MPDPDHRKMTPPSLRVSKKEDAGLGGPPVYVWDLRIAQPNVSHIDTAAIHSLEHFLGVLLPEQSRSVVNVAPLGCQTGFYIVTLAVDEFDIVANWLEYALRRVLEATEVPLANPIQCGWAENHTLVGAQHIAEWLLDRRNEWEKVV